MTTASQRSGTKKPEEAEASLEAIYLPAKQLSLWPEVKAVFEQFVWKHGPGQGRRHVYHVTHLLNYIAEKCRGILDVGSLRRFFDHLQSEEECAVCCEARRLKLQEQFGRYVSKKNRVGGRTTQRAKGIIRKFLTILDLKLLEDFDAQSWTKNLVSPKPPIFRPRLQEKDYDLLVHKTICDDLYIEINGGRKLFPVRRFILWFAFQFAQGYAELAALKPENIFMKDKIIALKRKKTDRPFPLVIYNPEKQLPWIDRFLKYRKIIFGRFKVDCPQLFFQYGQGIPDFIQPLGYPGYRKLVKELFQNTVFERKGVSTHEIRRLGAAHLYYDVGMNIRDVSLLLGHQSVATTMRYIASDVIEFRDRILKSSLRENSSLKF